MKNIFTVPIYVLLVILFQVSFLDEILGGWLEVELPLLLAVFAGFCLNLFQGGYLVILLGFFLDSLAGGAVGVQGLLYLLVFIVSTLVYREIYFSGPPLLMLYVFVCTLLKGLAETGYYSLFTEATVGTDMVYGYLPEALINALVAPPFFRMLERAGFSVTCERHGYIKR